MKTGVCALLALMSLSACQKSDVSDTETDLRAISSQLKDMEAVLSSGLPMKTINQNYLEQFCVDDLVLLPPGRRAIHGLEAALDYYNNTFGALTDLSVAYQQPEILIDGNLATRRYVGSIKFTVGNDSESGSASGRYVDVLQKQADGSWRIVWHTMTPLN